MEKYIFVHCAIMMYVVYTEYDVQCVIETLLLLYTMHLSH